MSETENAASRAVVDIEKALPPLPAEPTVSDIMAEIKALRGAWAFAGNGSVDAPDAVPQRFFAALARAPSIGAADWHEIVAKLELAQSLLSDGGTWRHNTDRLLIASAVFDLERLGEEGRLCRCFPRRASAEEQAA